MNDESHVANDAPEPAISDVDASSVTSESLNSAPPVTTDAYFANLSGDIRLDGSNRPLYDGLAKSFAKDGHSPEAFSAALSYYQQVNVETQQQLATIDQTDSAAAREHLANAWGNNFEDNLGLVRGFVEKLPPALRVGLESARSSDGTAVLNDPQTLEYLARLARGGLVPNEKADPNTERSKIEKVMRENRGAYNKDAGMQGRYRDLISQTSTASIETPNDAKIDAEISKIEKVMRENRNAYNKDDAMQQRYRELLNARAKLGGQ